MSHLPGLPHPGSGADHLAAPASHELVLRPHAAPKLPDAPRILDAADQASTPGPPPARPAAGPREFAQLPAERPRRRIPMSPTSLLYAYLLPDEDPWKKLKDDLRPD